MQMCAHSAPERQIIQSSWAVAGKLLRLKKRKGKKKKIQAQTAPFLQGAKLVVVKKDFQEHRGQKPSLIKKTKHV